MNVLLAEAVANARSRAGLTVLIIAGLAGALIGAAVVERNDVVGSRLAADRLVMSGYTTLALEPDADLRPLLTATDCAGLADVPGVLGATWLRVSEPITLFARRGPSLPTRTTGLGIIDILAAHDADAFREWGGAAVIVDSAGLAIATDTLGHRLLPIYHDRSLTHVGAVAAPFSVLGQGLSGGALLIEPSSDVPVASCIVLTTLADRSAVARTIAGAFAPTAGYLVRWMLPNADRFPDPLADFQSRVAQHLWIAIVGVTGALLTMYLRLRFSDYAFYRVSGLTRRRLRVLIALDLGLIVVPVTIINFATLIVLQIARASPGFASGAALSATGRAFLVIALWASTFSWLWSRAVAARPLQVLKDV